MNIFKMWQKSARARDRHDPCLRVYELQEQSLKKTDLRTGVYRDIRAEFTQYECEVEQPDRTCDLQGQTNSRPFRDELGNTIAGGIKQNKETKEDPGHQFAGICESIRLAIRKKQIIIRPRRNGSHEGKYQISCNVQFRHGNGSERWKIMLIYCFVSIGTVCG